MLSGACLQRLLGSPQLFTTLLGKILLQIKLEGRRISYIAFLNCKVPVSIVRSKLKHIRGSEFMKFDRASITHWKDSKRFTNTRTGLAIKAPGEISRDQAKSCTAGVKAPECQKVTITLLITSEFLTCTLPKEKWISVYDCNQNNDYVSLIIIFKSKKEYRNRRGGNHDSTHLHTKQNFKPLDISRTVPCIIASQAYKALSSSSNVPAALVINTYSQWFLISLKCIVGSFFCIKNSVLQ